MNGGRCLLACFRGGLGDTPPSLGRSVAPNGDQSGDSGRVSSDSVDLCGGNRVKEFETHEVETGLTLHDAPLVNRLSLVQDRELNPGEASVEARAPDHVGHCEGLVVFEDGQTVTCADQSRNPFHPGRR